MEFMNPSQWLEKKPSYAEEDVIDCQEGNRT
eukprot:CAMPEP_0202976900 /NCGR_PEP_ID=MMETSP1396-20130829/81516_1 /ASSEMBLY_ACC=CAM_ASM_000872 /TAXON_ID= /ORGANISM="Pseudokeronopsis sp., Strain Brazil" /LENGTH=30 /DNA_ID= /DNA_START= /DNA_END= /DNA_ORIENTATION=